MRYSVFSGGKRIRPILVLEACRASLPAGRALSGRAFRAALTMACAVEMVHAYSLVHDDLPSMDDDDYRRGKRTSHKVFGEANAILSGDALLTLAFNLLSKRLGPAICAKAVRELSEAIGTYGMVGGQAIDIEYKRKSLNPLTRRHINKLKTARLFEACAKLGAIAAGASDKKIKAMSVFGGSIGMAFQAVDDIMDGEGRPGLSGRLNFERSAGDATLKAKDAIKIFGSRAGTLKEIADLMLKRRV